MVATLAEWAANSRRLAALRRSLLSRLPFLRLRSDVVDVVYLTWLVPVDKARSLAPASVVLWQREGLTPFSILTYRHRHFGPAVLGPLRRLFGSPLQSNWRLYLAAAPAGAAEQPTVLFTHNVLGSLAYTLGARTMSDTLPADLPAILVHRRSGQTYTTDIQPGDGSAPSLAVCAHLTATAELPPAFARLFGSWREAVAFLALQDAAVAEANGTRRLAHAEIDLPIAVSEVLAAQASGLACPVVDELGPVGGPLCFVVPAVAFEVRSERLL